MQSMPLAILLTMKLHREYSWLFYKGKPINHEVLTGYYISEI